ncbi:MAG: UDP-2,4-diacetamido-2,4,6-trideoxy-beta-L-altropyranose hydrolase [Fusobacteriota bacterium]
MENKVYIFTEGGSEFGYGHLTRCSSLATEIEKQNHKVIFVVNGDNREKLKSIINKNNFILTKWYDTEYISSFLTKKDYVIIDSYIANKKIYQFISRNCQKAIYIDDTNRIDYPKGIVLNPSISGSKLNYNDSQNITYLYGPKYILLRSSFQNINNNNFQTEDNSILITFGGSDPKNLTPSILKILKDHFPNFKKNVIIGSGYDNIHKIKLLKDDNTKLFYNLDENDMKKVMLKSKLAITGAGQTIYELIITKTPFLAIQVAENQKYNINFLENNNFSVIKDLKKLKKMVTSFIQKKHFILKNDLIDDRGAKRVISILLNDFKLRDVKKDDIKNIFKLSNKDYVRKYSINKNKISWENHQNWFEGILEDPNIIFYIIENDNEDFLGQIRFKLEKNKAEISLSFTEKLKGKGLSTFLLKRALDKLKSEKKEVNKIIAFIDIKNKASKKLFENSDFICQDKTLQKNNLKKYILKF